MTRVEELFRSLLPSHVPYKANMEWTQGEMEFFVAKAYNKALEDAKTTLDEAEGYWWIESRLEELKIK